MLTFGTIGAIEAAINLPLHTWRNDVTSILMQGLAYSCSLAAMALVAVYVVDTPKVIAASKPIAQAEWIAVERPFPAFELVIPEAGKAPAGYSILRNIAGGGRKDVLSLGEPYGVEPYLWIEIYRPGREIERFGDAMSEIAARASDLGVADAVGSERGLDTKLGKFSIINFITTREIPRKCVGFVRAYNEPRLQISGFFCRDGDSFIEPGTLSCALDRLTLLAAGNYPKISALFAKAELRRNFCGERNLLMAPTPKYRALWKAVEEHQQTAD